MKILSAVVLWCWLAAGGIAVADDSTPAGRAKQFLEMLGEGKTTKAYEYIFRDSPILKNVEEADEIKKQTRIALEIYGNPIGNELFKEEFYGNSIIRIIAVQKFERAPLIWEFFFYKARNDWVLANLRFSDRLQMLLNK